VVCEKWEICGIFFPCLQNIRVSPITPAAKPEFGMVKIGAFARCFAFHDIPPGKGMRQRHVVRGPVLLAPLETVPRWNFAAPTLLLLPGRRIGWLL